VKFFLSEKKMSWFVTEGSLSLASSFLAFSAYLVLVTSDMNCPYRMVYDL
jgi:hypothetical protein